MRTFLTVLSCAVMLLAVAVPPAMARTNRSTPLYATSVQMHFSGPTGKTRTITEQVYIDAGHDCSAFADPMVQSKHPEVAGMTLTSVTCKDSAGAARPGGPAIVAVKYVSADGKFQSAVIDHLGSTTYDMKTCPFVVGQSQAAFVALVKGRFPGGKFVGAECMARPKYLNSFLKSGQ